jgi:hypothetical protein
VHEVDSGRGFVLLAPETLLELRTDLNAQRVDYESPSRCRLGNNDHMAVLHWSGDPEEIMQLETRLIANNHGRLKLKNDCLESKGRVVGMWHCVYVVWRWKKDSDKWPGFSDVDALDLGRRLAPVRHSNLGRNPEYLRTRLAPDRAAAILAPAR